MLAALLLGGVQGCVPSPTATPPLHPPFPTLPLGTDTPSSTLPLEAGTAPAPSPAPGATSTPGLTVAAPVPTVALAVQPMQPLVQMFASDSSGPISTNQPVLLNIIAGDDDPLLRVELYDNNSLYQIAAAPNPPPRLFTTIVTWRTSVLGTHRLRAIAFDAAGRESEPVELVLGVIGDNRRPSALITDPLGSTDMAVGAPLVIQGIANDEAAVTRLDLYVDDRLYSFAAAKPPGQTSLAATFVWVATGAGTHRLFLRAHDNLDQTGDSGTLLVNAVDSQSPTLTVDFERSSLDLNDTLLVHALALSPSGIARVELVADNQIAQVITSAQADLQTMLDAQLVWSADSPGDHTLFVRAYDRSGLNAGSEPRVIHVRNASERAPSPTPPGPTATPPATSAPPTATPQVVLPAPPTIAVSTTENPLAVVLPGPLHIHLSAHGSVELDSVELWAVYQGEATPIFLFGDSAKGATDKTFDTTWAPPRPGVAYLFADVTDTAGQVSRSAEVAVYLGSPAAPLATPAFFTLAPQWQAQVPTDTFSITFVQIGRALRGALTDTPGGGSPATTAIVSGAVSPGRVTFSVDAPLSLDFDCALTANPVTLACNYTNALGQRGSAVFTPGAP